VTRIDSSLQPNDSKWLDSFCDSTLTRLDQVMTLNQLEKTLDDSHSTLTRRTCDSDSTKMTRAHHWLLLRWSNNNVIHGSQRRYFFHKTKVVKIRKKGIVQLLSLVSTIRGTKLKVKTPATTPTKTASPQINCNVKGCDACKKKSVRCDRKATFHYKVKLQEVFRAGLNEIKYAYVDSKQHFYLQYHVAATENRH